MQSNELKLFIQKMATSWLQEEEVLEEKVQGFSVPCGKKKVKGFNESVVVQKFGKKVAENLDY